MKLTDSYISLDEIRFSACHGVFPQEALTGNTYIVNLRIRVDLSHAIETDALPTTLNYAEIYEALHSEMKIPSQLIEHVAGRMAQRLLKDFPSIEALDLTLSKQNPPMGGDLRSASVELHCTR